MHQDMNALVTAREAAGAFKTSIAVILMWRNRGTLAVAGTDRRGRMVYRWEDLLNAERTARQARQRVGLPPRARLDNPYERATA